MVARELDIYRGCTPTVDVQYKMGDDEYPSDVIADALAEATGEELTDLPPLYEFINPEVIDDFLESHDAEAKGEAVLSFSVETWNIFVRRDGRIRVCDATHPTTPTPVFEPSHS